MNKVFEVIAAVAADRNFWNHCDGTACSERGWSNYVDAYQKRNHFLELLRARNPLRVDGEEYLYAIGGSAFFPSE